MFEADVANYQKLDILPVNSFNILLQRPWNGKTSFLYLFNKKDKSIVKYGNASIYDDLTGNIELYPSFSIRNNLICIVNAEEILKKIENHPNTEQFKKFKIQMKSLTEEDNPIIIMK